MLHLRAWRPYELNCVADAFSTQCEVKCETAPLTAEQMACTLDETAAVTCSGPLPDENTRLLACFASFGPVGVETEGEAPVLKARVQVTAFGQNSLDEIDSYDKTAELVLPLSGCPAGELWPECWLSAESLQAGCTGGALEVTVQVRAQGRQGEALFDIARRFHVSPGQMLEANGLEAGTQTLAEACRLLVPGAPGN